MQEGTKLAQQSSEKLWNRVELLTNATENIRTGVENVVKRVDIFDSEIIPSMGLLQTTLDDLQESNT